MFVCMCESVGWLVGWLVCVCVCLRVCLSVWSAGVFICLWTAPECLCALSHCFGRKNKKTPARRFGAGCQKTGKKKCGGREEKKKKPRQPRDISILAPRFPQAAGGRLQNGSTPRHRVGSALSKCLWMRKYRLKSFLPFPPFSSSLFFSPTPLILPFLRHLLPLLPPFCPSFIAHRKGISSSPVKLSLNAAFCSEKNTLFLYLALAPSLEPRQSSLSRWGIFQSLRSPFFTKTWCLSPGSCL